MEMNNGRLEGWMTGRLDIGGLIGALEGWKTGKLYQSSSLPVIQPSNLLQEADI
jgi:hypothetical protein